MGARKASGAIRFVQDFDYREPGKTTAYKVGHVVEKPTAELLEAAGDRAEAVTEEPPAPVDGE